MHLPSKIKFNHIVAIFFSLFIIFLPFKKAIQNIFVAISKSSFPPSKDKYLNKIQELEKENLLLSLKIKQFNSLKDENEKLSKALKLKKEKLIDLVGAEVLAFSPSNWRRLAIINKGSNDGLNDGQFAIDENGNLLGKIIEIDKTSSRLILIDDPEFTTSVFVAKKDFGLLQGNLVGAKVLYIEDGSEIKNGDKVWLNIPSINFPIEIGEIKKVKNNQNSLFWDVDVNLFTKNSFFEKIFIIK